MTEQAKHTPGPFSDEHASAFREMSLYWKEVRQRDDTSPLMHEARTVAAMLRPDELLRAVEFCLDAAELRAQRDELRDVCAQLVGFAEGYSGPKTDKLKTAAAAAIARVTP